jgi:polyhydroxyalkanoate synthase
MGEDPASFDILAWNNDSSNMSAQLHKDFLQIFDSNCLIEPGGYEVLDQPVVLADVVCDKFVVGAVTDHLTPWKCCYKSQKVLGGDTVFALSNGGHVAALVNPPGNPKAYHWMGPAKADTADAWMESATRVSGSWWESWTQWCGERSGDLVPAPKVQGSKAHPPIMDAPGDYVRQ